MGTTLEFFTSVRARIVGNDIVRAPSVGVRRTLNVLVAGVGIMVTLPLMLVMAGETWP